MNTIQKSIRRLLLRRKKRNNHKWRKGGWRTSKSATPICIWRGLEPNQPFNRQRTRDIHGSHLAVSPWFHIVSVLCTFLKIWTAQANGCFGPSLESPKRKLCSKVSKVKQRAPEKGIGKTNMITRIMPRQVSADGSDTRGPLRGHHEALSQSYLTGRYKPALYPNITQQGGGLTPGDKNVFDADKHMVHH